MELRSVALLFLVLCPVGAQAPARAPLALQHPVQDKNFYLLSSFEATADARAVLRSDAVLAKMAGAEREALHHALASCEMALECYADALKISDTTAASAGSRLNELYSSSAAVRRLADVTLRRSGMFQRYASKSGDALLVAAWMDAVRGIDSLIEIYGTGRAPRYPAIDSATYDVHSDSYRQVVRKIVETVEDQETASDLFFEPALRFALFLMDANGRDEAGRLEPLEKGENADALRHIPSIVWSRFPYTMIVVPGAGPDRPGIALSPSGKMRVIIAAKRYREGKAPLIFVSGGYVHPAQTPFSEAVEMKKYLIANLGVPGEAILIDPHARHTTTNMRNAARQIYRYGIPFDRPALVTSDTDQSRYIEGPGFAERCMKELGYMPYRLRNRVSPFDVEFFPMIDSLQADSMDPLDP